MTFEQELYAVVRKWRPSPDLSGFEISIRLKSGQCIRVTPNGMELDDYEPTARMRYYWLPETWRDGEKYGGFKQLQQLYRNSVGQEQWRAVEVEG